MLNVLRIITYSLPMFVTKKRFKKIFTCHEVLTVNNDDQQYFLTVGGLTISQEYFTYCKKHSHYYLL